ncbi:hypothetical protein PHLCEN_2v8912 [Hermanssonia centrifuga]|uniref:Cleavage stimulation factor subunit 2 n=1 Tax=Hermanssonia centrifuga TaxID=98765 RepID=A0A2R6NSD5_9APHY|nr:hypothetical protein PHLCEN_2v8912 [Hermanssonia centrifuga]
MSAVRNLNGQEIGGRPLRIDIADSDPFLEGKTTIRGELVDAHETRAQWRERERERDDHRGGSSQGDPNAFLNNLPMGTPIPPGLNAMDAITQMLAAINPTQILEVLAQMKAFVITHPDQARALLVAHPQLGYALFQALLLNKIVDTAILEVREKRFIPLLVLFTFVLVQRMLQATTGSAPPSQVQPPPVRPPTYQQPPIPPPNFNMPPPPVAGPNSMYPPHMPQPAPHIPPSQTPYYRPPPPMPPQTPATAPPAPAPGFDPASRDMLMQVLRLTPEQINSLPPAERDQIHQLVSFRHTLNTRIFAH